LEEKISSLAFDTYIIFRPGLLLRKDTDRLVERLAAGVLRFLNTVGLIKKFRPMTSEKPLEHKYTAAGQLTPKAWADVTGCDEIF
jgi:hypothetical protein